MVNLKDVNRISSMIERMILMCAISHDFCLPMWYVMRGPLQQLNDPNEAFLENSDSCRA